MRGGSASGCDDFLNTTLRSNIAHLLAPIKHLINLSITSGIFRNKLKLDKVIPLYKSNNKSDMNRLISFPSAIGKVLEKCVKIQWKNYLETNNLISASQYGFRKSLNNSDTLYLINKLLTDSLNNNVKVLLVFIDLAKDFESVDRKLLFTKLRLIRIK